MTYQPGQLAMVTAANRREEYRAFFDGTTWRELDRHAFCVDTPVTLRPLVVLDLGDVPFLGANNYPSWLRESAKVEDRCDGSELNSRPKFLRWLADQIEAQTRPAIEEPKGLGAVVEDADGIKWVHMCTAAHGANWARHKTLGSVAWVAWSDLNSVRVLSEGVPS